MGIVIVVVVVIAAVAAWKIFGKAVPSEEKLQKQKEAYEALLEKYEVPEEHYRIVIGQSKVFGVNNCPAVVWRDGDMVKTLVLGTRPILASDELEDFLFIASHPYIDFKRFDGTEYPDWAVQSAYVKNLFLPFAEVSDSYGGIDRKKQMYWIGTICLYAPSLAQMLRMLGKPLTEYAIRVDNRELMKSDGSIPEELL